MRRPTNARDAAEAAFKSVTKKPERVVERAAVPNTKESVTLRLDAAIVEAYQAAGPGWQTRMVEAIAAAVPGSRQAATAD